MRQSAGQRRRAGDDLREGFERRRGELEIRQLAPMPGGARSRRRRKVPRARRRRGGFQPVRHLQLVQHRRAFAAEFLRQDRRQRVIFRVALGRGGFRLGGLGAGLGEPGLGLGAGGFRGGHRLAGGLQRGLGGGALGFGGGDALGRDQRRGDFLVFGLGLGETLGGAAGALLGLGQSAARGFRLGGDARGFLGGAGGLGFGAAHGLQRGFFGGSRLPPGRPARLACSCVSRACSSSSRVRAAVASATSFCAWPWSRVRASRRARASFSAARARFSTSADCSLAMRARSRAVRATASSSRKAGKAVSVSAARAAASSAAAAASATSDSAAAKAACGFFPRGDGEGLLDRQQLGLGGADIAGKIAIAAGLARLALQLRQPRLDLAFQVVGAGQVLLGLLQFQLGFVAAGMQAGDAGGLFQQRAALIGAGVHQRADSALAHHRRGAGAGGEVGEQRLHVAGARLLAVHPVGAARAAFDFPGNFQVRRFVEGRRGEPGGFFQRQRHFREVARGRGRRCRRKSRPPSRRRASAGHWIRPWPSAAPR